MSAALLLGFLVLSLACSVRIRARQKRRHSNKVIFHDFRGHRRIANAVARTSRPSARVEVSR